MSTSDVNLHLDIKPDDNRQLMANTASSDGRAIKRHLSASGDSSESSINVKPLQPAPFALHVDGQRPGVRTDGRASPHVKPALSPSASLSPSLQAPYAQPVLDASKLHGSKRQATSVDDRIASVRERRLQQQRIFDETVSARRAKEDATRLKWEQSQEERKKKMEESKEKENIRRKEVEERKNKQIEEDKKRAEAVVSKTEQQVNVVLRQKRTTSADRTKRWSWGVGGYGGGGGVLNHSTNVETLTSPFHYFDATRLTKRLPSSNAPHRQRPASMDVSHIDVISKYGENADTGSSSAAPSPSLDRNRTVTSEERFSKSPLVMSTSHMAFASALRSYESSPTASSSKSASPACAARTRRARSVDNHPNKRSQSKESLQSTGKTPENSKPATSRGRSPNLRSSPNSKGKGQGASPQLTEPMQVSSRLLAPTRASIARSSKHGQDEHSASPIANVPLRSRSADRKRPSSVRSDTSSSSSTTSAPRSHYDSGKPTSTPVMSSVQKRPPSPKTSSSKPRGESPLLGSRRPPSPVPVTSNSKDAAKRRPSPARPASPSTVTRKTPRGETNHTEKSTPPPIKQSLRPSSDLSKTKNLLSPASATSSLANKVNHRKAKEAKTDENVKKGARKEATGKEKKPSTTDIMNKTFTISSKEKRSKTANERESNEAATVEKIQDDIPVIPAAKGITLKKTDGNENESNEAKEFIGTEQNQKMIAVATEEIPEALKLESNFRSLANEMNEATLVSDEEHHTDAEVSEIMKEAENDDVAPSPDDKSVLNREASPNHVIVHTTAEEDINSNENVQVSEEEPPSQTPQVAPAQITDVLYNEKASVLSERAIEEAKEEIMTEENKLFPPDHDSNTEEEEASISHETNREDVEKTDDEREIVEEEQDVIDEQVAESEEQVNEMPVEPSTVDNSAIEKVESGKTTDPHLEENIPTGETKQTSLVEQKPDVPSEENKKKEKKLTAEELAYKEAIAAKRREMKERMEREEKEKQERLKLEAEQQAAREETARRMAEEARLEQERLLEEEKMKKEEAEKKKKLEAEEMARKHEEYMRAQREKLEQKAREGAEKIRRDREIAAQKKEEERLARKKRLEMIMRRTRGGASDSPPSAANTNIPSGEQSPATVTPTGGRSPRNSLTPDRDASPVISSSKGIADGGSSSDAANLFSQSQGNTSSLTSNVNGDLDSGVETISLVDPAPNQDRAMNGAEGNQPFLAFEANHDVANGSAMNTFKPIDNSLTETRQTQNNDPLTMKTNIILPESGDFPNEGVGAFDEKVNQVPTGNLLDL